MRRACLWFLLLPLTAFGAGAKRPKVDQQAMREAMHAGAVDEEAFGSSASYAHYLRAQLAHHAGEHTQALDQLRLALASDDANPFLLTSLAEEYTRLNDLDRAERELRKVIERNPAYVPAQFLMGRVLLEGQKYTRARLHLERAIRLKPRELGPYLVLTQLSLELNRPDEAERVIDQLAAAVPGEPVGMKRLGLAFAERKEPDRAQRMLKRAADKDPGDVETWVGLAQVLETQQKLQSAEEAYGHALEADPENREVLLAAGRLALQGGAVSRARAYFDQLLSLSGDPELAVKVAFSYLASRQNAEAAAVLDNARRSATHEPRLSFYSGLVHEKLGQFSKAAEAFGEVPPDSDLVHDARLHQAISLSSGGQHRAALTLFRRNLAETPDALPLYAAYSRALERAGSGKEAEELLRNTLKARPAPELFEALAGLLERQGRPDQAIELLSQALKQKPRDEALLYTLGETYERRGEHEKSLEKMRAVLAINPENPLAMNFIGYTLAEKGVDFDEAERLLQRALELRPGSGPFLDSLGWIYFRRGDLPRAVDTLEKAAALAPGEPTIIEHLGDAYRRASRQPEARAAYRQALEALRQSPEPPDVKEQRAVLERKLKLLSTEGPPR